MSTLYLVRHGQASYGAADYDVLSPLGAEQGRRLGAYVAEQGLALDALYTGTLRRQIDTARHMLDGARAGGVALPEPEVMAELDEYPAMALIAQAPPPAAGGDALRHAFEDVILPWARGELRSGELETYAAFEDRVRRGLGRIVERHGRGERVAVVTSGGPIGVAMHIVLGLDGERAMHLAWVVANTAVSELRHRGGELGLVCFNTTPHLPERGLVTYR